MSTSITFNGSTYTIPAIADAKWGANVTNYLVAIASGALQKSGGTFTLTAEIDFGATYGIKSAWYKSKAATVASTGAVRLGVTEVINWKANVGGGNVGLGIDGSDRLTFNSVVIPTTLTAGYIIVGSAGAVPTGVAMSGDISIDSSGVTYIGALKIDNAMIKTAAVIAFSKMAALTASHALVSGSGGVVEVSATTAAELAFVNGVTSAIQTQINSITTSNVDTNEPHGIVGTPTVTYLGSRVIRIAHPYSYYYRGVKVTSTVNKNVTVTNTSGSYYVCFTDAAHTAAASTSIDYPTQVPFAGFFWNATTGDYIFEKEAHIAGTGSAMMHEYLHDTRGAAYDSGGAISG